MSKFPIQLPPSPVVKIPKSQVRQLGQTIGWGQEYIDVEKLWKIGTGRGVAIFILDTVDEALHSDLKNRNHPGLNFNATGVPMTKPNPHGTHCAGIAAAENNGVGTVGYAFNAVVGLIRTLLDNGGGNMEWPVEAIDHIINLNLGEINPDWKGYRKIISCSWGSTKPYAPLKQAIDRAVDAGIIVTAAAGNEEGQINWPAHYSNVISIGSFGRNGKPSSFSTESSELDVVMPGEAIISTVNDDDYAAMWGTSMANPAGAGLIACLLEAYPQLDTPQKVERMLEQRATDIFKPGFDYKTGYGIPFAKDLGTAPDPEKPEPEKPRPEDPPSTRTARTVIMDVPGEFKMPWRTKLAVSWDVLTITNIGVQVYSKSDLEPLAIDIKKKCSDFFKNKGLEVLQGMDMYDALYWTAIYMLRLDLSVYEASLVLEARTKNGTQVRSIFMGPAQEKNIRTVPGMNISEMDGMIYDLIIK
jgi:hypothetical protein